MTTMCSFSISIFAKHLVQRKVFAAFCRGQNIPCYAVDGISYEDSTVRHTWNRVYYDGIWWNMDVTHDISSTAAGKSLYGFRKLDSAFAPDADFYIIKIY